ncbi:MAG: amidase, partial [Geodermatophilaceae bacterium]
MSELNELSVTELLSAIRAGRVSALAAAESCLRRVEARDPVVRAFAHVDADLVRASAAAVPPDAPSLPLTGLPVGIKDVIDVAGLPAELGSPIYAGRRPAADAGVVRRLRATGAVVLGKTVTTEFALYHPGSTVNPHDPQRTPGGSSSGSAAAIADAMVPVAVGTQTAGSVVRPASFCGVVGFKPTFGAIDRTGVKLISPSLDTVGLFARTVTDVSAVFSAIREGSARPAPHTPRRPRSIGFVRTAEWHRAEPETRSALEALAADLTDRGLAVVDITLPTQYDQL